MSGTTSALGGAVGLRKGGRASSPSPRPGCCPHRSAWSRWPSSLGCPASWSARRPSRLWPKNLRSGRGMERGAGARAVQASFPPQGWDSHPLGPGARPCQEPRRFSGALEGFKSLKHFLSKSPAPWHHQAGDPQRGLSGCMVPHRLREARRHWASPVKGQACCPSSPGKAVPPDRAGCHRAQRTPTRLPWGWAGPSCVSLARRLRWAVRPGGDRGSGELSAPPCASVSPSVKAHNGSALGLFSPSDAHCPHHSVPLAVLLRSPSVFGAPALPNVCPRGSRTTLYAQAWARPWRSLRGADPQLAFPCHRPAKTQPPRGRTCRDRPFRGYNSRTEASWSRPPPGSPWSCRSLTSTPGEPREGCPLPLPGPPRRPSPQAA